MSLDLATVDSRSDGAAGESNFLAGHSDPVEVFRFHAAILAPQINFVNLADFLGLGVAMPPRWRYIDTSGEQLRLAGPETLETKMTTTKRRYFVAVNKYRTSTSNGFSNTWEVQECEDRAHQLRVLEHGLPYRDLCYADTREPIYGTMGVRLAAAQEIREAKRDEALSCYGEYDIPAVGYHHAAEQAERDAELDYHIAKAKEFCGDEY